jgi:hypothetical protein
MQYGIAAEWWALQPRVSTKSGWVVRSAHHTLEGRVERQIALCKLGTYVMQTYWDYRG